MRHVGALEACSRRWCSEARSRPSGSPSGWTRDVVAALGRPRDQRCGQRTRLNSAMNGERICATLPNTPRKARLEAITDTSNAPTPTGLMSYRWARLNSMPGGLKPERLVDDQVGRQRANPAGREVGVDEPGCSR